MSKIFQRRIDPNILSLIIPTLESPERAKFKRKTFIYLKKTFSLNKYTIRASCELYNPRNMKKYSNSAAKVILAAYMNHVDILKSCS